MSFFISGATEIGNTDGTEKFLASMNTTIDFEENHIASQYIDEHYYKLVDAARKMCGKKIADPSELVHEVWVSIKHREDLGQGYDPAMGIDGYITVAQYVYGCMKKYALKYKYKTLGSVYKYEDDDNSANAGDSVNLSSRKVVRNKNAEVEIPAYSNEDLALIYQNAQDGKSEQSFEMIDDLESINAYIEELFNYGEEHSSAMRPFLKNLKVIGNKETPMQDLRAMFSPIIEFVNMHDTVAEALFEVISFAIRYPTDYDKLVASL